MEATKAEIFNSKPRSSKFPLKFNGLWIDQLSNDRYQLHQCDYSQLVTHIEYSKGSKSLSKVFQSIRGKMSYITTCTRLDLSYYKARLSHISPENLTRDDCALLNSNVVKLRKQCCMVIRELQPSTLHIACYSDASSAKNLDLTPQLCFIVLLKDAQNNEALMHYGLLKCHCVMRSVLCAEVYAFTHCLDYVHALVHDPSGILCRKVKQSC